MTEPYDGEEGWCPDCGGRMVYSASRDMWIADCNCNDQENESDEPES